MSLDVDTDHEHDGGMQIEQSIFASYAIPAIVLAVVLAIRWKRLGRLQPLKLERLWIMPAIFAATMVFTFVEMRPNGWGLAFCLLALIFVVVLVLLRRAAAAGGAYRLHLDTIAVTDMLMAFALGLIAVQRLEMFLRARRLLAASRAIPR